MKDRSLDFSFSGIKTAVLWHLKECAAQGRPVEAGAVAKGFQAAVVDALVRNVAKALEASAYQRVVLGGGVAANRLLRHELERACAGMGARLFAPSPAYCTDNAAMIGFAGGRRLLLGERSAWDLGVAPSRRV
jgi:N6-L-threonylcarbamoyladenine synthase